MTPAQQAALDEYLAAVQGYSQYTPEQLKAAELGASSLQGVTYDPKMLEYEMSALRALEEQGREGLTAQDRAAMAQFERETGQAARGRRGAIEQSMRQRGISGSGLDLVSQLQSAESANELAAMKALEREGLSAQRRTQGQLSAGQMAGQLGSRQYQQAAEKAAAQDRIAQFNAANRMNAQQYNIGMGAQTAANRMQAQTSGAQMKYNAASEVERARLMREEERRRKRQGALSAGLGAVGGVAGAYFGMSPQAAAAGYQIGSGLGNAIQGFANGGRVQPYGLGLNLPQPSDTVPAMLTPGEMVLPQSASQSPDAAAAYVDAYNKAEQDVASAKQMRDVFSYADIAAKGLSDYAQSQAPTTYLPRRFEELGRGPEAFQTQMPQYQAGSLAQLGEAGVARAKEGLGAAKEKFGMDTAMEKYKIGREYDDPKSQISQRANLLLKSQLKALQQKAITAGDIAGAKELMKYAAGPDVSANQAMQTLNMVKSVGDEYGDVLNYLAQKQRIAADQALKQYEINKEQAKAAKTENKDLEKLQVGNYGIARTEKEAQEGRTAIELRDNLKSKLQEMINLRKEYGGMGGELLEREPVNRGKALAKEAQLIYKDLRTLGALTGPDLAIIEEIIPSDPLQFDIMSDTSARLENLLNQSQKEFESKLKAKLKTVEPGAFEQERPKAGGSQNIPSYDDFDDVP
jgi:hypothetical protein